MAAIIGGGLGFIRSSNQPIVYKSTTTVSIGNFIQMANPTVAAIDTGLWLAPTYAHLVTTEGVLQGTADALDLPFGAETLHGMVSTRILLDTTLLMIDVKGDDPVLVADISDEVARQLIDHSPSNITDQQQIQLDLANQQTVRLNAQLEDLYQDLAEIDDQMTANLTEAATNDLEAERLVLVDNVNYVTSVMADYIASIAYIQQQTNSLEIVEHAQVSQTGGRSKIIPIIMSMAAGGILAFAGVVAFEYIDDHIRTVDQAVNGLNLPFLGAIRLVKQPKRSDADARVVWHDPIGPVTETYHAVRTNLLAAGGGQKAQTFMVVSAGPGEGKSMTATNLAISLAMADFRTVLIDADLRRPTIHEIFQLPNQIGMSTLLKPAGDAVVAEQQRHHILQHCLQATGIPNLSVITSGPPPNANPSALLSSPTMQAWHEVFQQADSMDYIIFDTPPSLAVADSVALTSAIDARSLLVVEAGRTRRAEALRVKQQFEAVGKPLTGVILNKARQQDSNYYSYDYMYYPQDDRSNTA